MIRTFSRSNNSERPQMSACSTAVDIPSAAMFLLGAVSALRYRRTAVLLWSQLSRPRSISTAAASREEQSHKGIYREHRGPFHTLYLYSVNFVPLLSNLHFSNYVYFIKMTGNRKTDRTFKLICLISKAFNLFLLTRHLVVDAPLHA